MTRQTSMQLDENTEALIAFLKDRGFGTTTNIVRTAIRRMAEQENKMTTVVFQPDMDTAEVVSIIKNSPHHIDGEFYDFASPDEAAAFVTSFVASRPEVRITGEYTRRVVAEYVPAK